MTTETNERRLHQRFKLTPMYTAVTVQSVDCLSIERLEGHAYDISESGVRLELDEPLEKGQHVAMYLELPGQTTDVFVAEYTAKYPKAAACLNADRDRLLTFFALPAEHWQHVRTSNVIESPFATVRLRQRVTKGAGSRTKGLLMAYKLLEMAQQRWRRLNGAHLLPLVRAGVRFIDGVQQERHHEGDRKVAA